MNRLLHRLTNNFQCGNVVAKKMTANTFVMVFWREVCLVPQVGKPPRQCCFALFSWLYLLAQFRLREGENFSRFLISNCENISPRSMCPQQLLSAIITLAVCAAHYPQFSLLSAIIILTVCAAHYPQWTKSFPAQQASTFGDQVWISYFVCTMHCALLAKPLGLNLHHYTKSAKSLFF